MARAEPALVLVQVHLLVPVHVPVLLPVHDSAASPSPTESESLGVDLGHLPRLGHGPGLRHWLPLGHGPGLGHGPPKLEIAKSPRLPGRAQGSVGGGLRACQDRSGAKPVSGRAPRRPCANSLRPVHGREVPVAGRPTPRRQAPAQGRWVEGSFLLQ